MKDRDAQQLSVMYEGVLDWMKSKLQKDDFKPNYSPSTIKQPKRSTAPVKISTGSFDGDTALFAKQPFTAFERALDDGHHPKLWQAVKGTPYENRYIDEVMHGQHPEKDN